MCFKSMFGLHGFVSCDNFNGAISCDFEGKNLNLLNLLFKKINFHNLLVLTFQILLKFTKY